MTNSLSANARPFFTADCAGGSMEMTMQGTEAAMCSKTGARKAQDSPKLEPKPDRRRQNEQNDDRIQLRGPLLRPPNAPPAPLQLHAKTTAISPPPPYAQLTLPLPPPPPPPCAQITSLPSPPHAQSTPPPSTPPPSLPSSTSLPQERPQPSSLSQHTWLTPQPSPPHKWLASLAHEWPTPSQSQAHARPTPTPSPPHAWPTPSSSPPHEWPTPSPSPPHEWPTPPLSPPHEWPTPSPSPTHEWSTPSSSPTHEWPTPSSSPPHEWPIPSPSPPHEWPTPPPSPPHEWPTPPPSPPHEWPTPSSSPTHEWPTPSSSPPHARPTLLLAPPPLPPKQTKLKLPPPLPPKQTKLTLPPPLPPKQTKLILPPPLPPKQVQLTREDVTTSKARNRIEEPNLRERENLLPRNWIPIPRDGRGHDVTVHLVKLAKSSAEYQDVAERFYKTVQIEKIKSIERIQNPFLYQAYQLRKQKMDRDYGGNNELQLFHGTNAVNVAKINTQEFDRSFAGSAHGHLYGTGVYFSRYASYSMSYSVGSCRVMYLARVLVGKYCKGEEDMRKPPPIDPKQPEILFDSMVNDMQIPSLFVVYYDNQCYPEYLITF